MGVLRSSNSTKYWRHTVLHASKLATHGVTNDRVGYGNGWREEGMFAARAAREAHRGAT